MKSGTGNNSGYGTATKDLLAYLNRQGVDTVFDRRETQQPQCKFGLIGSCCHMCLWGPCRISSAKKGICGRDAGMATAAHTLRSLTAGLACQMVHAREVLLTVAAAAEGKGDLPLKGRERVMQLARKIGLHKAGEPAVGELAGELSGVLMDGLGDLSGNPLPLVKGYAPRERVEKWLSLGILPRSASLEIAESLHMTALGGCSDAEALMHQALRSALSYCYSALFASSFGTEILYGIPEPVATVVNFGVLKEGYVNILVHGHSPVMVEKVLEKIRSEQVRRLARDVGARGIVVGGMCCTGNSLLASYGVPSVTDVTGQELAIGTGAVDAVVVDMQCVIPGLKIVADCMGTEIITTCSSNRIPGATHIPFDPARPESLDRDAMVVAKKAVEAYARRGHSRVFIPATVSRATAGWSYDAIAANFGGLERLLDHLMAGRIAGIATIIGCSSPKVPGERAAVTLARSLIGQGILVTTTGCAAHALLNAGLCAPAAASLAHPDLRALCTEHGIPPVLAVGGCVDNARTIRLFSGLAQAADASLEDMPFAFVCPEPGSEKAIGLGLAFLCHGISGVAGFPTAKAEGCEAVLFSEHGLGEKLGAVLYAETDPQTTASLVTRLINEKRVRAA